MCSNENDHENDKYHCHISENAEVLAAVCGLG